MVCPEEKRPEVEASSPQEEKVVGETNPKTKKGGKQEEIIKELENFVTELFTKMGYPKLKVDVWFRYGVYNVNVILKDKKIGNIIGKRGETLKAIENLLTLIFVRQGKDVVVKLDINRYHRRRLLSLKKDVEELVEKVKATGKRVVLDDLSPREREVVYRVVRGVKGIKAETLPGFKEKRSVAIFPAENGG